MSILKPDYFFVKNCTNFQLHIFVFESCDKYLSSPISIVYIDPKQTLKIFVRIPGYSSKLALYTPKIQTLHAPAGKLTTIREICGCFYSCSSYKTPKTYDVHDPVNYNVVVNNDGSVNHFYR